MNRYSPDGRPYYVDHNHQVTTWEHPIPFGRPGRQQGSAAGAGGANPIDQTEGGTAVRDLWGDEVNHKDWALARAVTVLGEKASGRSDPNDYNNVFSKPKPNQSAAD